MKQKEGMTSHERNRLILPFDGMVNCIRKYLKVKSGESSGKAAETSYQGLFKHYLHHDRDSKAEDIFVEMVHQLATLEHVPAIEHSLTNRECVDRECRNEEKNGNKKAENSIPKSRRLCKGVTLKEKPVPYGSPGRQEDSIPCSRPWQPEDWLILFGMLKDRLYQYRLDYDLVKVYRNYRFEELMKDDDLQTKKARLFNLKAAHIQRKTNLGGLNHLAYKSPLNFPHRMLPSEFALPRSRLIEKIVLEKALVYEDTAKRLILDKTLITLVMDCSQVVTGNEPPEIRMLSSRVKALGGIILDFLYYYLYGIHSAQVDIRLILFLPPADPTNSGASSRTGGQTPDQEFQHRFNRFAIDSLFSQQCSLENIKHETPVKLPETLLSFRQLRGTPRFQSPPFFTQHHSICTSDTWQSLNTELFHQLYRDAGDERSPGDYHFDVAKAYREEFTRLFGKLRRVSGKKEVPSDPNRTYSSRHICHITPQLHIDGTEREKMLKSFYNKLEKGQWDSVFHFEVKDGPRLDFLARDYTSHPPRGPGSGKPGAPLQSVNSLRMFLKRIMHLMILARSGGGK